jgi:hypothetical protein
MAAPTTSARPPEEIAASRKRWSSRRSSPRQAPKRTSDSRLQAGSETPFAEESFTPSVEALVEPISLRLRNFTDL